MIQRHMDRADLDGIGLEYETRGSGEPVVLIHPGYFADWFAPLLDEPVLTDHYRVVSYHRVGCAGSSHIAGPVSLAQQAGHCRSLMRHLGIERAHIVGHSSSGNIALQLALDAPDAVHSLAILEPALYSVPSAQTSRAFVGAAVQLTARATRLGLWISSCEGSAGQAIVRCWIKPCRAPSISTSPTQTRSSTRNCPPCNSGHSRGRPHGALPSRSSRS
jgi:pimeloyl-ACP methyl ester carboxylesterase